jgi:hypothetical protein
MKSSRNPSESGHPAANNTVKLSAVLRERISKAMEAEGFSVWSEFCRVALTEKCKATEQKLLTKDPSEFLRIYKRMNLIADGSSAGG